MKLGFVFVGGHKEEWLSDLSGEYLGKLKPFCSVEIIRLKPTKLGRASADVKQADESSAILQAIKKEDHVILCDERGVALTSKKFSEKLVAGFERTRGRVVFVVGGAFGANDELKKRADLTVSLSTLVFNHHIAQAVLLEQTYRAFAIWKNLPYHND